MRSDVVRMYKDVHTWVGIVSGLALFIAFYAGAITMFETQLQRWASPPVALTAPPPMSRTQELVDKTLAARPQVAKGYNIVTAPDAEAPARMMWMERAPGAGRRAPAPIYGSSLAPDGSVEIARIAGSDVAEQVDVLHQQIGLPLSHDIAMPIMGLVCLLYGIALISGTIVLLPSLVKDLFAVRVGRNLKRMWLDTHNVLGLFSLPFHIVICLTAVVFAFHDQFYDAQDKLAYGGNIAAKWEEDEHPPLAPGTMLPADELLRRVQAQAPGFRVDKLYVSRSPDHGLEVTAWGENPAYGHRGAVGGWANVNPYTGAFTETDYMPGMQPPGWMPAVSSFFTLHFGSFGGLPVRWAYFFMGLAGAMLFYTGNLLWVESRRKKERKAGPVTQSRSTQVMGALTVGVTLGCVAGISLSIAAAKWLPGRVEHVGAWHSGVYYATFVAAIGWALWRGAARAGAELLFAAALATLCIPLTSLLSATGLLPGGWSYRHTLIIDATAIVGALALILLARNAHRRAVSGITDSIWSVSTASGTEAAAG
jgi:uncharacterized iron-regulated membrane protein